jgi:hypothetical protein
LSAVAALGLDTDKVAESNDQEWIGRQALVMKMEIKSSAGTREVRTLLDSGAQMSFISHLLAAEMRLPREKAAVRVRTIGGQPLEVYGEYCADTLARDEIGVARTREHRYLAAKIVDYDVILGHDWLSRVNPTIDWSAGTWRYRDDSETPATFVSFARLLREARDATIGMMWVQPVIPDFMGGAYVSLAALGPEPEIPQAYRKFSMVFSEPSEDPFATDTKTRHSIPLMEGETAPYGPIYALSAKELRVLREYLESAMAKGWIQHSESEAGAPILFVAKPDGSLRLCVDYRGLNRVTKKNRYPLPLIPEILDRLVGAKIFTKLDLRDAYHRIRIEKGDRWKTAFRTRYGHFEYLVMPFGLTNAPASFQAYINEALKGLLDDICVAFMDDILIFSQDETAHESHVNLVLERLKEYGLYVKLSKCEFSTKEVDFLGYRVGTDGVSMDPRRVAAIQEWPVPKSFRDIQVFLGFANFYRGFVWRYSAVAAPITDLLVGMKAGKKTGPFTWTAEADAAFRTLKACFSQEPMLAHYDPEKRSRVEVDASGGAIGGVMSQEDDPHAKRPRWKPVAFFSRKMTPAEKNYDTGDGEMLAIVHAFKEWRHYLESPAESVIVLTDHAALQPFMTTKILNRRQMRWAELLAAYDFQIQWRRGKDNPADGLSRRPDHMVRDEEPLENVLKQILQSRMPVAEDTHATRIKHGEEVIVGVTTRAEARRTSQPWVSEYNVVTLPTPELEERSSLSEFEANLLRNRRETLANRLKELQSQDEWCREEAWKTAPHRRILKGEFEGVWSVDEYGLARRGGRAYVPHDPATRQEILYVNHDDPWQGGHFGEHRTGASIMRHYWWPHVRRDILEYVKTCDICQRMKVARHRPYGRLEPLPLPKGPWQDISMDFITGLPPSLHRGVACDSILVIVDRYSKMVILTPCVNTIDAPGLGQIVLEKVVAKYGAPRSIVSDRGSLFTSTWFGTMCAYLATRRLFSTAFHPQTDGQTERMNQTLEVYLRCYTNYEQSDWAKLLASAEYAMNSARNATTGKTPFSLVLQFDPETHLNIEGVASEDTPNDAARLRSEQVADSLLHASEAQDLAERQIEKMVEHYDKKRTEMFFNVGDKVLLSSKNIRMLRASKKLADQSLGPFTVLERIGKNAYRLDLPKKYGRLHHTFHISLLHAYRARPGVVTPEPVDIDDEEEWEVERILKERQRRGKREFYVRWKGFSEAHDSWEPEAYLRNAREEIEKFTRSEGETS